MRGEGGWGQQAGRLDGLLADPVFGSGDGMLGPLATSLAPNRPGGRDGRLSWRRYQRRRRSRLHSPSGEQPWESSASPHFSASICLSRGGQGSQAKGVVAQRTKCDSQGCRQGRRVAASCGLASLANLAARAEAWRWAQNGAGQERMRLQPLSTARGAGHAEAASS
jgi:hypothetical protein